MKHLNLSEEACSEAFTFNDSCVESSRRLTQIAAVHQENKS